MEGFKSAQDEDYAAGCQLHDIGLTHIQSELSENKSFKKSLPQNPLHLKAISYIKRWIQS